MKLKLPDDLFKSNLNNLDEPSLFDELCARLDLKTAAGRIFLRIALENTLLMDGKQVDYGSKNISGFGTYGVVVRMSDKMERIKNLFGKKRRRAVNESILDSFRDISNYANIAIMTETKNWPNE